MQSRVGLARFHGERLGHLSRHRETQQLYSEVEALRAVAQKGIDGYAFRKAFMGAGGYEMDWQRLVAPVVKGRTARRAATEQTGVAASGDGGPGDAPAELRADAEPGSDANGHPPQPRPARRYRPQRTASWS